MPTITTHDGTELARHVRGARPRRWSCRAGDGAPRPELARRCADVFPHAEVAVQPGTGHYPWLDDPRWFVRCVAVFLAHGRGRRDTTGACHAWERRHRSPERRPSRGLSALGPGR
ncbi:alpha/beta fold hydrolase [Streptomyces sp. WG5]|uniref:alpha/beta fold hydrolase n=1 Tax=Streptomyces sp. WG5 TaxID=3417648 RepID=UPI003CEC3DD0